jgi:23S rRNA pseudouridine955/2504/2580 synthase
MASFLDIITSLMNTVEKPLLNPVRTLVIQPEQVGQRIDNFLISQFKGVPKSRIYRCLRRGEVRVNKARVAANYRLQRDDRVRLPPLRVSHPSIKETPASFKLRQIEQSLLYEDKNLLFLNKPAGIPVHSGSGVSYGVIEILRALRPQSPFLELVHRLDRETSGCLIIAKNRSILRTLHLMQREHQIQKRYFALVKGQWQGGSQRVELPLVKNTLQSGERVVKVKTVGKRASSYFHPKQFYGETTLMEVALETGRTHQIRVHAAYLGHPLGGDEKYGDPNFNKKLRQLGLGRLFLHAYQLTFTLPGEKKAIKITAPLPDKLQAVLKALERGPYL